MSAKFWHFLAFLPAPLIQPAGAITATPFTMLFEYSGVALSSRNLTLTSANSFTAQVTTNPVGWLDVSPRAASVPAVLIVAVNPGGLAVGEYAGLITIRDADPGCRSICSQDVRVTLNVRAPAPPSSSASTSFVSQVVDGAGWKSSFIFVNTTASVQRATINFWDGAGLAMRLSVAGLGQLSSVAVTLGPNGARVLETNSLPNSPLAEGWASIRSDVGGAVAVTGIIRLRQTNAPDFEVGSPAIQQSRRIILPFDNSAGFASGLALVNTGSTGAINTLFRDEGGQLLLSFSDRRIAGTHISTVLSDLPELANRRGTVEISSSSTESPGVVGLVLRFNPTGPITGLPPSYQGN